MAILDPGFIIIHVRFEYLETGLLQMRRQFLSGKAILPEIARPTPEFPNREVDATYRVTNKTAHHIRIGSGNKGQTSGSKYAMCFSQYLLRAGFKMLNNAERYVDIKRIVWIIQIRYIS